MKKKTVRLIVLLLLCAVAFMVWFAFSVRSFDRIDSSSGFSFFACDPVPKQSLSLAPSGSFPGFSDTPVSWEDGRNYRALYLALRKPRYLVLPGLFPPPDGGTAIYELSGCVPMPICYWAEGLLWLPTRNGGWRPCLPLTHGAQLRDTIAELAAN